MALGDCHLLIYAIIRQSLVCYIDTDTVHSL